MFQANVIRIFIASPMDVEKERAIVRDSIFHWNTVHSANQKTVFLPVGWETHAAPDSRDPAQELIDKRLLTPCDVLIGLFWARIGSRTRNAVSGTVHEISAFKEAHKRAAVYFCTRNIPPALVSSAKAVERLRKQLNSIDAGLTGTYSKPESLRPKIDLLLNEVASENASGGTAP